MTPCDGCPFVACRDCRWQGGDDENDRRHMGLTDALWMPGDSRFGDEHDNPAGASR